MTPARWLPVVSAAGLLAQGCTGTKAPSAPPSGTGVRMTADERAYGVLGRSIVVPLDDWIVAGGRLRAWIGDEETPLRVARIERRVSPEGTRARPDAAWLGSTDAWSASEYDELPMDAPTRAGWVAIITLPIDALGKPLRINRKDVGVNYLPPPTALGVAPECWTPVLPAGVPVSFGRAPSLAGEAGNPLTRWRWRLVIDGLHPDASVEPFPDEAIEELARQVEDRWRVALARLWGASPETCVRLRRRLGAIVDFGNSEWAPAWPPHTADLERLHADLLSPDLSPEALVRVAEAYLAALPPATAWIIDDGGVVDQSRRAVISQIGVAGLADHATMAWAVPFGHAGTPHLTPLPPMTALTLASPASLDPTIPLGKIEVNVGRWRGELAALSRPLPVQPPGLAARAFLPDWTMDDWEAGTPRAPQWPTAALIQRPAAGPGDETVAAARRWEIFVECRFEPGAGELAREQMLVYLGPAERPVAVIRVRPGGEVEHLPLPGRADAPELLPAASTIPISRGTDRWSFRLAIPPGAIERDGLCRVALVRIDALGRRSAWPRAMLPWQAEPGRAALDTSAWTGLASPADVGP